MSIIIIKCILLAGVNEKSCLSLFRCMTIGRIVKVDSVKRFSVSSLLWKPNVGTDVDSRRGSSLSFCVRADHPRSVVRGLGSRAEMVSNPSMLARDEVSYSYWVEMEKKKSRSILFPPSCPLFLRRTRAGVVARVSLIDLQGQLSRPAVSTGVLLSRLFRSRNP